jgi:hypothetical protein
MEPSVRPEVDVVQGSALWHFHDYDLENSSFTLLKIDEPLYRSASFLDQRVEPESPASFRYDLEQLESLFPDQGMTQQQTMFIFHIGHCGSTLLSRALASSPEILPVREPMTLRHLAGDFRNSEITGAGPSHSACLSLLGMTLRALGRNFRPGQTPVIKATSTCNNLILPLLERHETARAILMYVTLESYLAGMLGKQSPPLDLQGHALSRMSDWDQIKNSRPLKVGGMAENKLAVLAWLSSMRFLLEAKARLENQAALLDFEIFLQQSDVELARAAQYFAIGEETEKILAAWPKVSSGYSKKPDFPYSAQNRRITLQRGRLMRGDEIRQGMQWAEELINETPALAACGDFLV